MPDPLTGKTFGFLYAEVQQQMFSKESKNMKQNDLSTGTITVSPPSQAPSLGKGNTGPDIQPSTPGPRMDGSVEQGLGCRLSGFTGPSLHPALLPAALPPLYRGPACYAFGEDGSHSAPSPCSLFRHKEKRIANNQQSYYIPIQ